VLKRKLAQKIRQRLQACSAAILQRRRDIDASGQRLLKLEFRDGEI
jgi:hypothetical protein